ncbi:hypothetical protein [Roseivivax sp. CAU 1761]
MAADLALTLGLVGLALAVPAMVAAWSDRRAPRLSALLAAASLGLLAWAWTRRPGGYGAADAAEAVIGVAARLLN